MPILDIKPNASEREITKAYKLAALRHHPDKGGNEENFKQLRNEYEKALNGLSSSNPQSNVSSPLKQDLKSSMEDVQVKQTKESLKYKINFTRESSNKERISALFNFVFNPSKKKDQSVQLEVNNKVVGHGVYLGRFFETTVRNESRVKVKVENPISLLTEQSKPRIAAA